MHHMNQCISMSVRRNGALRGENEGGEGNLVENKALKTHREMREERSHLTHK